MQFHSELDMQPGCGEAIASTSRKRSSSVNRRVTVRLSETLCERLEVATERPGVGKSMVVEAALEHFLQPAASAEELVQGRFDELYTRFDRLERDMRMMAETVALHARYHLAVMPPLPQSRQQEAMLLGDERFRILAEQVDHRVRNCRPLMQETIDRLNSAEGDFERTAARDSQNDSSPEADRQKPVPEEFEGERVSSAFTRKRPLSNWRLILSVFLPFAAGYFLSFLFRTINAAIGPALVADFGLDAAKTGLLSSIYFLVFAGAQIPIGMLLDRYGPRSVQSVLLVIAVGGASLFGTAEGFAGLLVGRAMIGLGFAASLMAGLKAIVTWFPRERLALVNGCMIMLGSLGAVTATAPTDWLMRCLGWRGLFELLTVATLATAGLIYFIVPERDTSLKQPTATGKQLRLRSIFTDTRFLRIAPLSAACIGSSWALQSLWAASWLTDVERFDRQDLTSQLFTMAASMSVGALLLGTMADRLRRGGIATEIQLAAVSGLFILSELAVILRAPVPSILPWSVVSVVSAGTVLSYAIIADYFPVGIAARANGALSLLHFGWAFIVQYGIGAILSQWTPEDGHYPLLGWQTAFGFAAAFQVAALVWFVTPWLREFARRSFPFSPRRDCKEDQSGFAAVGSEAAIFEAGEQTGW